MADKGTPSSSSSGAGAAVGFNQAEIDALLKSSAGDNAPSSGSTETSTEELSQADMETLEAGLGTGALPQGGMTGQADSATDSSLDVVAAMQEAIDDERASGAGYKSAAFETTNFDLPDLTDGSGANVDAHKVSMLQDVNLRVRVELGRTKMLVEDVLKLGEGSIVELEKLAGDPVDVYVNDRLLARGEVLVLNDSFCVRVSEVFTPDPHRVVT